LGQWLGNQRQRDMEFHLGAQVVEVVAAKKR
jgi:hypothetical protein